MAASEQNYLPHFRKTYMKYIYTHFRVMYEVGERFNGIFPYFLFNFSEAGMAFQGAAVHRKDEPGNY